MSSDLAIDPVCRRRRRTPAWLPLLAALCCAFGFRWLGGVWAAEQQEPWTAQLVFVGVAMAAALIAAAVGRIWATPAAAIVLGVAAGILATRYDDNLMGAGVGLAMGAAVGTAYAWKAIRCSVWWLMGTGSHAAVGLGAGAVAGACFVEGGFGWVQGVGVLFAAWLVRLAMQNEAASRSRRWTTRLVFGGALAAGMIWLAPSVQPWLTS